MKRINTKGYKDVTDYGRLYGEKFNKTVKDFQSKRWGNTHKRQTIKFGFKVNNSKLQKVEVLDRQIRCAVRWIEKTHKIESENVYIKMYVFGQNFIDDKFTITINFD